MDSLAIFITSAITALSVENAVFARALGLSRDTMFMRSVKDGVIFGWISLYLEYQKKDAAYLSVLYIKEACRSRGYGSEIIEALARELAGRGFKTIKTHCSLRNALALRFWVRNGFDRITEIECDGNLYPDNFGGLGLRKNIIRNETC